MNRLHRRFGDKVDFFQLDINDESNEDARFRYQLYRRSQYALLDKDGNILAMWIGPLYEEAMTGEIEGLLADLDE